MAENYDDAYDTRAILDRMRDEYWRGISEQIEEEALDQLPLLSFLLSSETFAMHAIYGKEILKVPQVIRVPRTPPTVLGIINLRGTITPIIDVRVPLGLKASEVGDESRVIVTEVGELYTGILVEQVLGITQAPGDEIKPVSSALAKKDFLEGQVLVDEKPLVIINLEKLLSSPDFRTATTIR